jgi:hypothetical protein
MAAPQALKSVAGEASPLFRRLAAQHLFRRVQVQEDEGEPCGEDGSVLLRQRRLISAVREVERSMRTRPTISRLSLVGRESLPSKRAVRGGSLEHTA